MHKPVLFNILHTSQSPELLAAIQKNYRMALNVAILNMIGRVKSNEFIPMYKLYEEISHLSYAGDIRHSIGV